MPLLFLSAFLSLRLCNPLLDFTDILLYTIFILSESWESWGKSCSGSALCGQCRIDRTGPDR